MGQKAVTAAEVIKQLAKDFADIARKDNPLFDRSRFLTACSIKDIDIV